MAETSEERTEEPTSRRLQKAREEGQVARSTELPAAAVTIASLAMIYITGEFLISKIAEAFVSGFQFDRKLVHSTNLLPAIFGHELLESFILITPLLLLTVAVAIASSGATGGFLFEMGAVRPKAAKLNPINGFKRMFGMKAAVELTKAVLKFTLVAGVVAWVLYDNIGTLNKLGKMAFEPGMAVAGALLAKSVLIMACALAVIALIDVPFQRWQFMKQMRMTKQEVKDEMKDIEGRPEVKAQIRRRQREMAAGHDRSGEECRCRDHQPRTLCGRPVLRPQRRQRAHPAGQGCRRHSRAYPRRSRQAWHRDLPGRAARSCALLHHRSRPPCAGRPVLCGRAGDRLCVQPRQREAGRGAAAASETDRAA